MAEIHSFKAIKSMPDLPKFVTELDDLKKLKTGHAANGRIADSSSSFPKNEHF